jgi:hypothetical protein
MDHQDWPEWPADDPDLGNADTADLHGDDDLGGGLGHGAFDHDLGGGLDHELGDHELGDHELGGPEHDLYRMGGYDDGVDLAAGHQGQAGGDVYPDDDPFSGDLTHAAAAHDTALPDVVHPDDRGAPFDHTDPPVGADPDVDPRADDDWHDPTFPPALDLADAPEPVDGYPWSDADLLGAGFDGDPAGHFEASWREPDLGDLYDYAGEERATGGGWQALLGSDDPATSTLARWWAPGT